MNSFLHVIRKLELKDIDKNYFELLQNLSLISINDLDKIKNQEFIESLDEKHQIWIIYDTQEQKIIATGTLLVENKLIRNYGKVGHIEDIVVAPDFENQGVGKRLVSHLVKVAEEEGCYKCILHCNPNLVSFYEKNNFTNYGCHMRQDF